MTFRCIACLMVLVLGSQSSSYAQNDKNAVYYCTAEAAGGLAFNPAAKKWMGLGLTATNKFVLRLKFLKEDTISSKHYFAYEVTIADPGEKSGSQCKSNTNSDQVEVGTDGAVICQVEKGDGYRIGLHSKRYLHTSPFGYYSVDPFRDLFRTEALPNPPPPTTDEESENPYIEGGTCTKIE
jgi:hypothetical protein